MKALKIALQGSILNGFNMFISLIICSLISEDWLASEKDSEHFLHITSY